MDETPRARPEHLQRIYDGTEVRRSPLTGVVPGHHNLPFILIGPDDRSADAHAEGLRPPDGTGGCIRLTGTISVSPRLVIPLSPRDDRFSEIFPEGEPFMDRSLVARVFSFSLAKRASLRVRGEGLRVELLPETDAAVLERTLDFLDRSETIDRGVIWCPEPRFYPVGLERFIASVLDRELR